MSEASGVENTSPFDELTDQQREQFEEFKKDVKSWDEYNDDAIVEYCTDLTLFRFLSGLLWDSEKAANQLRRTLQWRREFRPQDVHLNELKMVAESGWMFHQGHDKEGRPLLYIIVHRDKTGSQQALDIKFKHIVHTLEHCYRDIGREYLPSYVGCGL
ncbi:rsc5 [Acrasis kona]|uniref:Rsc5 n=1 Tax=Acrasis kona TaxID=1008807 RepID=A0AAW2YHL3_9EUKA